MSRDLQWRQPPTKESVARLVNFTDAVAGITLTLLILPLVDIGGPTRGESILDVMEEHSGTLLAFVLSFTLTLNYWRRHHRMLDGLESFTPRLVWLNGAWLLALVFLEFPAQMLGTSGPGGGVLTLYCAVLCLLYAIGVMMSRYLRRVEGLIPPARFVSALQIRWMVVTAVYLAIVGVLALWLPWVSLGLLGGLLVLGGIETRQLMRQPRDAVTQGAS